jgi:radical SAM protein with 4Fe4S-binding SPASM domain
MAEKLRVVHYLNQFFGQVGGEEKASTGFLVKEGPVGPGLALQKELGDRGEVVATVICGDDSFAVNPEKNAGEGLKLVAPYRPDLFFAGPAFAAGRYSIACGAMCKAVGAELGIPVVSVATTVTGRILPELGMLHGILLGLGVRLWRLAVVMPIGRALESRDWLSPPQLKSLLEFVEEHRSPQLEIYLGENLPYLGQWETRLRDRPLVCPVGFTACCLGVDGGVRGCPEQPDTDANREGSVLEMPLDEIWQRGFARYRRRQVLVEDPACASCKSRSPCYGGCWVMREEKQHCARQALGE